MHSPEYDRAHDRAARLHHPLESVIEHGCLSAPVIDCHPARPFLSPAKCTTSGATPLVRMIGMKHKLAVRTFFALPICAECGACPPLNRWPSLNSLHRFALQMRITTLSNLALVSSEDLGFSSVCNSLGDITPSFTFDSLTPVPVASIVG